MIDHALPFLETIIWLNKAIAVFSPPDYSFCHPSPCPSSGVCCNHVAPSLGLVCSPFPSPRFLLSLCNPPFPCNMVTRIPLFLGCVVFFFFFPTTTHLKCFFSTSLVTQFGNSWTKYLFSFLPSFPSSYPRNLWR